MLFLLISKISELINVLGEIKFNQFIKTRLMLEAKFVDDP